MLRVLEEEEEEEDRNEKPVARGRRVIDKRQHSLFGSNRHRGAINRIIDRVVRSFQEMALLRELDALRKLCHRTF